MTYSNHDDELYHYGVLGMKGGVRRARINMEKSNKARAAGNNAKAEKYKAKSMKIQIKHMKRVGGKKAYEYSAKESVGKSFVKSMVLGTYGALKYNEAKARSGSTMEAAVNGWLYGTANLLTGFLPSIIEPRIRK